MLATAILLVGLSTRTNAPSVDEPRPAEVLFEPRDAQPFNIHRATFFMNYRMIPLDPVDREVRLEALGFRQRRDGYLEIACKTGCCRQTLPRRQEMRAELDRPAQEPNS